MNLSGRCHYHPDRPGLGVCVECRRVICSECSTQFEGINRCASCLEARLVQAAAKHRTHDWTFGAVAGATVSSAILFGCFWIVAFLASR